MKSPMRVIGQTDEVDLGLPVRLKTAAQYHDRRNCEGHKMIYIQEEIEVNDKLHMKPNILKGISFSLNANRTLLVNGLAKPISTFGQS